MTGSYQTGLIAKFFVSSHSLRNKYRAYCPSISTNYDRNAFYFRAVKILDTLSEKLYVTSLKMFKICIVLIIIISLVLVLILMSVFIVLLIAFCLRAILKNSLWTDDFHLYRLKERFDT